MKHIVLTLKILFKLTIIKPFKKCIIMDAKKESIVRIVVQFVVTMLGTLLGINL